MTQRNIGKYQTYLVREGSYHYAQFTLSNPEAVVSFLNKQMHMMESPVEQFVVLYLNCKNKVTGTEIVSRGALSGTSAAPRNVFQGAILANAASIICSHQHPSRDPSPSKDDKELTRRLYESGEILGIKLLDHIILGNNNSYFSFKEEGFLG